MEDINTRWIEVIFEFFLRNFFTLRLFVVFFKKTYSRPLGSSLVWLKYVSHSYLFK